MKIKRQFVTLIVAIAILPLFFAVSLPFYHYLTSPQRFLMKGYNDIRNLHEDAFSKSEWDEIHAIIKEIPSNMQMAVYSNNTIMISNFPDLKQGAKISKTGLFWYMSETSDKFDYQVQTPSRFRMKDRGFMVICRVPAQDKGSKRLRYLEPTFILILIFELVCIVLIVRLSRTIFSSIQLLEINTQKIADGELDTQLELPKKTKDANEITSLAESLDRMRISLKDNQERRNKFIMGISHDLRTPVALIKGYSEAITDGVVSDMDSVKKSLSIIESKADQLEAMINDLINYMKLNTTEWRQHLGLVKIKPVLEDFTSSAIETANVYNRKISAEISIDDQTKIFMDKNLFTRALENIFSNALRYTKDGDSISIRAIQSDKEIKVSVEDTGIGIEQESLAHIYDIFYRGTSSRREQGMGIGLSVVKTVIDSHGWTIDVKSEVNKGTCFLITIPLLSATYKS